jgi:hypothetical protein
MTTAPHLLNEDRPDFSHVLDDALRIVLEDEEGPAGGSTGPAGRQDEAAGRDPMSERDGLTGRDGLAGRDGLLNAEQLRTLALAAAEEISRQAAAEYHEYVMLRAETREEARESASLRDSRRFGYAAMGVADEAGSGAGLAAVIAVLTPLLAGAAAVIFLLIGYLLSAVSPEPAIASPLRTAGWFFAIVTGAAVLLGGIGLLLTALRDGSSAIHDSPEALPPDVARARERWHQALLDRGMLPFLDEAVASAALTPAPEPPSPFPAARPASRMPHLGYSRPDFSSPQDPQSAPRHQGPRYSSPDFTSPDFGGPDNDR